MRVLCKCFNLFLFNILLIVGISICQLGMDQISGHARYPATFYIRYPAGYQIHYPAGWISSRPDINAGYPAFSDNNALLWYNDLLNLLSGRISGRLDIRFGRISGHISGWISGIRLSCRAGYMADLISGPSLMPTNNTYFFVHHM